MSLFQLFIKPSLWDGTKLADKLTIAKNHPTGFDYMRILLAIYIICYHSIITCYGIDAQNALSQTMWRPLVTAMVPMFFALSGFLVASSLERAQTTFIFLGLRALRIMPALAVETAISAFIIGPLFTTIPSSSYFTDEKFFSYLLNSIGNSHYLLPGLFQDIPHPNVVNGQLWTIDWELGCYAFLAVLGAIGIYQNRIWMLVLSIAAFCGTIGKSIFENFAHPSIFPDISIHGKTLVAVFIAGVFFYRFRDKIPYNRGLFFISCILSFIFLSTPQIGDSLATIPLAYLTIYLGLLNPRRNKIILSGDYSYGLYLYGYPLQQAISTFGPTLQHWYWNLLIAIPCTILLAVGSWWSVEQTFMRFKEPLKKLQLFEFSNSKQLWKIKRLYK